MAINSSTKFGVVYSTPSDFVSKIGSASNTSGKLYVLQGNTSGGVTQGIYMVESNSNDPDGMTNVTMLSSGALATSTNAGLISAAQYDKIEKDYLLESNYVQVDASNDGYVPKCDASDGTIDSSTKDWVLAYDSSSKTLGWYKLPANAFLNDKGVTSVTISQGAGITVSSTAAITSTGSRTISLKQATDTSIGGIKLGYTTNDKNYKVELDENGDAFVNVPWIDKPADSSHADSATIADKVANSFKVQGDGTDIITFNGSVAKTINIVGGTNVSLTKDTTNGKITINADIPGALVYQGVVSTLAEINAKNCTTNDKGDVYVASANFSGTITKNNLSYTIEKGDMFICNGSSWDIVNGEGQVTNGSATLDYAKSATIATVDGVDITLTGPATPVTSLGGKTGAITLGTATSSNDKSVNFSIDSSNKISATVPSLSNYLKSSDASTTYLSKADASTTYLKISDASYFNTIKVGDVSIIADSSKDTLTFVAGDNITLTPDASNDKITISATDTVYSHPAVGTTSTACTASANTDVTLNSSTTFTVVNGVYRDASGHVNKVATTKYTMPASAFTDTKCTSLTLSADTTVEDPSTSTSVNVLLNSQISASGTGASLTGSLSAVKVPTQKAIDDAKAAAISEATIYWETL